VALRPAGCSRNGFFIGSGEVTTSITFVLLDLASGFPGFETIGMPDNIVKESKDRVKASIRNGGYHYSEQTEMKKRLVRMG
jgi:hypothetical protein